MVKFILIKSPDEWATTKQACRDELVVYWSFSSIYIYIYTLWCVQVYPTKSALHPQVGERYNSSMNGTSRLTFAYRPVSWRL